MKISILLSITLTLSAMSFISVPKTDSSPVETNWRTIMELVYRPSFDNLKARIGSEASGTKEIDYGEVQRDALILSEFTARLHQWPDHQKFDSEEKKNAYVSGHKKLETATIKQYADTIYQAAKDKNFERAKKSFVAMTKSCNVCHIKHKSSWVPVKLEP